MKATEIIALYTKGEKTLEETNAALYEIRAGFHLNPERNTIKEDERDRFGLLDTGTGYMDKVEIVDGELKYDVNTVMPDGKPNMKAYVHFNGKVFEVYGKKLEEV